MDSISDIVRRLAENAEAVCRRYLSNGRREGRYWLVGDVHNAPGRSLYVLLSAAGDTRAQVGKWTDAASGEHGDLLDIIAARCGHGAMRETLAEARRFLSLPLPTSFGSRSPRARKTPAGTPVAARRLWAAAKPVGDTLVAAYLAARGTRGVPQVAFRPDWNRDKKAAPFKRNERLIDAMPTGLIVFSGTGIQDNLVDKARAFGIPVWDFRIKEAG